MVENPIMRIWHGWTTPENADVYESLLKREIFPSIEAKRMAGFESIQLLRREGVDEVEFVTIMRFSSLDAVKGFVGGDHTTSYVPDAARRVLSRFDDHAQHYELRESYNY